MGESLQKTAVTTKVEIMSVAAAYIGIILIWSTTPLAIQWSNEGAGFEFGVMSRMVIGALLCVVLLVMVRMPLLWHLAARQTYLASGLGIFGGMTTVYWAAQYIPSGLIAVVYGLLPMVTAVVAAVLLGEPFWQPSKLLGMVFGLLGLMVIFNPQAAMEIETVLGVGGVLLSVILHSTSMVWIKRIGAQVPALMVTTGGLWVSLPLFIVTWLVSGAAWSAELPLRAELSILYLGVVGSVVGFMLFYYVLHNVKTERVALITLITPVCALALGSWLNGEVLRIEIVAGAALILLGLAIHQWGAAIAARIAPER